MKSVYVNDLRPNQDASGAFLVQSKDIRQKKSGEPYLSLSLSDKTGEIDAKMWDNVREVMDTFDRDDFVSAKGRVQLYQNKPQFTIHKLRRLDEAEVDFADFFPASARDPEEMFAELREIVAGVGNPYLKALLDAVLEDEEIARRFRRAPAAKSVHHARFGGLIEHVLSLCALCRMAAGHYKFVDLDLLLAGAVLHDIGKIYELSFRRSFGYTSDGQLLGHIVIGLRIIGEKLQGIAGFPPRLRTLIEHMVISHHGALEFGSPKLPAFPEALLLHYLDNMDSKMENMRSLIEKDQLVEGCWTSYSQPIERYVLKKDKYLAGAGEEAPDARLPAVAVSEQADGARKSQASVFGERLQEALRRES